MAKVFRERKFNEEGGVMKRNILVLIVCFFVFPALVFADEYVLVMSKDDNVCQHMLDIYNNDLNKYGHINYDKHKEFNAIKWTDKDKRENKMLISKFDINNDGRVDIVVKQKGFLKGILSETLYYFDGKDEDYFNATAFDTSLLYTKAIGRLGTGAFDQNAYELKDLPKVNIGPILGKDIYSHYVLAGQFYVNPFIFKKSYYTIMRNHQLDGEKWLVILKFMQDNEISDVCYFLKTCNCKKLKGGN